VFENVQKPYTTVVVEQIHYIVQNNPYHKDLCIDKHIMNIDVDAEYGRWHSRQSTFLIFFELNQQTAQNLYDKQMPFNDKTLFKLNPRYTLQPLSKNSLLRVQ